MLVLSRKVDQKILIGDDIEVMVVRLGANSVRIGITAPLDKVIVRQELKPESEKENGGNVS